MSTIHAHCRLPNGVLCEPRTRRARFATRRYTCRVFAGNDELFEQNKKSIQLVLGKRKSRPPLRRSPTDPKKDETPGREKVKDCNQDTQNCFDAAAPTQVLSDSQLLTFERLGHICTPSLLDGAEVSALQAVVQREAQARELAALSHRIQVLLPADKHVPAHSRDQALRHIRQHSQELGFLQHFNLHREVKTIRSLVTSQRLAAVAAQLLGEKRVRLYQDCVFLKEPGFTPTNWHSDLPISPLDTNSFVTAWIPLRPLKGKGDSGLEFAEGSHRDIAVHAQADGRSRDLSDRGYCIKSVGKMDLGDVSWHHGWVLHYAPPQPLDSPPRMALAVSYFADGARIRRAEWSKADCMLEDSESYADWLGPEPGKLQPGAAARHALLPLVYGS